jgi:hypothetical protein
MKTFTIFNHMIGFELWCPLADFANWQLGSEKLEYESNLPACQLYWFGPYHLAVSKVKDPMQQPAI